MSQKKTTIKSGRLYRAGTLTYRAAPEGEEENRSVELTFSSEEEVTQWFGKEVLGHSAGEVDLSLLESSTSPLLVDHNTRDQIGVIEQVEIGADRRGRAVARFGRSGRAEEIFQDVKDGIRSNVSVGYRVNKMVLQEENEEGADLYRVTDWQPFEISIVSVPADPSVGVGRGSDDVQNQIQIERSSAMSDPINTPATPAGSALDPAAVQRSLDDALAEQRKNATEILALGARFNKRDIAERAIADGMTIAQFRGVVLENLEPGQSLEAPEAEIGLSENEKREYSLFRALEAAVTKDWDNAGFEYECHKAVTEKLGRRAQGFYVPHDVFIGRRDLSVGTPTAGGHLVGTDHLSGEFIDLLRNQLIMTDLGARMMSGLVGNVDIPRQTGAATAYWLGESGDVSESNLTFGNVTMAPKTVAGRVDLTRRLMMQSSPSAEQLVWDDLLLALALAIDYAAINGSGAGNEPTGVLNTTGIGDVAGGANGAAPTWANIVDLETDVSVANAAQGNLSYLTNALVRGKGKTTLKVAGDAGGGFLWERGQGNGVGELNGYAAHVTNQVPSNLVKGSSGPVCSALMFGNWADLLIGEWGVLDIKTDDVTLGDSGGVVVRAFQDIDVAVRRAASFSAMQDALTD